MSSICQKKLTKTQEKIEIGEQRRKEEIIQIQNLYQQGYPKKKIAQIMKTTPKRVRKYCTGDPENLCKNGNKNIIRKSVIDEYYEQIKMMLAKKMLHKDIFAAIRAQGYVGGLSILNATCGRINKGLNHSTGEKSSRLIKEKKKFITKRDIFKYIWSEVPIYKAEKDIIYERYPEIKTIYDCVREFRKIFAKKDISLLNKFINKFSSSNISNLKSFANGLLTDIKAVESAVTSKYSNGKTEGNNHRLKLIKRTMYGRAKLQLLKAKVLPQTFFMPIYTQN